MHEFVESLILLGETTANSTATIDWIGLVSRFFHILGALILVGGSFYLKFVVEPTSGKPAAPDDAAPDGAPPTAAEENELAGQTRKRWARLVAMSVAFLLVTGLYTMAMKSIRYKLSGVYLALFSIKFLMALFVFFVCSVLAGKTELAQKFRARSSSWRTWNLTAGMVIIALAGVMRVLPAEEKPPRAPNPPSHAGEPEARPAAATAAESSING